MEIVHPICSDTNLFCSLSPGFLLIMHPGLMFVPDVKNLYNDVLSDRKRSDNLKIQVLKNLQTYLQEEDSRMQEADRECECCSQVPRLHSLAPELYEPSTC